MRGNVLVLTVALTLGVLPGAVAAQPKEGAVLMGHTDCVFAVAISPDGKTVASGSVDAKVKLWDVGEGKLTARKRPTVGRNQEAAQP